MQFKLSFCSVLSYNLDMKKMTIQEKEILVNLDKEGILAYALGMNDFVTHLTEQNLLLRRIIFSDKSEKMQIAEIKQLFNEMETIADLSTEAELKDHLQGDSEEQPKTKTKKKNLAKKKKKQESAFNNLPEEIVIHDLEDFVCPECGGKLVQLKPKEYVEIELEFVKVKKIRHIIRQYHCPLCSKDNDTLKLISPAQPPRLISGSVATPSLVANVISNKFALGIPLYRQAKGVPITRQNMSYWALNVTEFYLEALYNRMHEDLVNQDVIHMDETTLTVLENKQEKRSKSYMWVAQSGKYEENQIGLAYYCKTRKHENVQTILGESFKGAVHSDGYKAYRGNDFENIACMAHVRRKFYEA